METKKHDFLRWLRDQIWHHDELDKVAEANEGSFNGERWLEVVMRDGRRFIVTAKEAGRVESSEDSLSSSEEP